ncbi:MMPL family transporter [Burkholderia pyrrocinia]|uniref:MMPL family transporter n=1 Tax=Burkholderia pyrrocinia TaxID=60550 RepID=UPI00158C0F94|nr:MMPL family transporter [Burkholderia pyrrocinia]
MDALQRRSSKQVWGMRAAWLVFALVSGLYCVWRFAGPSPLQTNLLGLLPATEVDPVAEEAVDKLAATLGDRTVFLLTSDDATHAKAAAKQLGATLSASGAFRSVIATLPPFDLSQIGALYRPYRFGLLAPTDRALLAHAPNTLRDALVRRLYSPAEGGLSTALEDDPFGWLAHWLGGLPLATSNLEIEDSLLVSHRGATTSVLVMASLPGSAYETETQRSVVASVAHSEASLRQSFPDVTLARTGAVFYAQSARSASEHEMHAIGVVTMYGIALLMLGIFRSPRLLLLGFVSTALGIVGALALILLVFGQLHLLTLVFGASLIGEAVDYSIQYFIVYLDTRHNWDSRRGARAVAPALTVALATSLLGYVILACAPFPALKQIACFAVAGISIAFASVLTLLPTLLIRASATRPPYLFKAAGTMLQTWRALIGGRRTIWVTAVLLIASVPGWLQLRSDDDIHLLIQRDPSLVAQEHEVTRAAGVDNTAQFFVVRGETPEIVLERAEALGVKLDALSGTAKVGSWQSVSTFVPSLKQQRTNRALLAVHVFDDAAALRAMLLQAGFRDTVADAWIAGYASSSDTLLTIDRWVAAPWSQPFRHLWLGATSSTPRAFAAVVIPQSVTPANEPALLDAARAVPGVSFVDKAASVSKLFGEYRVDSSIWLAGALLLVLILLMLRYGPRGGLAVTLPVLLAVGVTLAAFGYAHIPFTLFNWLALMLVLGVGANYAVFLREGTRRADADPGAVWTGVLLSSATTLLSFGMLGMSSMPALRSFGATLSLGITVSVLLAPIGIPSKHNTLDRARSSADAPTPANMGETE